MTARRINKGWYVDFQFRHADGQRERIRVRSPVQTKRGADEYERQLKNDLLSPLIKKTEVPTLGAFADEFLRTYVVTNNKPSEARCKEYRLRLYIVPFFGKKRLDAIGVREIEHFRAHLMSREPRLELKTQRNVLAVLSKMLRYAEEIGLIDVAPRVRLPKAIDTVADFLDFDEAERLLDAAQRHYPEWYAMVFTGLRTGLRIGERTELRWPDLDLNAGRLMVRRNVVDGHVGTPKNGRSREIPLSLQTVALLRRHRHLKKLVFCHRDGSRITHRVAYRALHKICRVANVTEIGWHTLRHSFASHLVMNHRSLKEVQELLGHSDFKQTLRCAHLAPSVKRDAVETLGHRRERQDLGAILGSGIGRCG